MPPPSPPAEGLRITIRGTVQGVGMRPFVYRVAGVEGVRGRVRNDARGVTIEAFAGAEALRRFVARLEAERPPAARFDALACERIPDEPVEGFAIVESEGAAAAAPRVSIPPDLATCPDCLRELFDPADRRYRYPFTNCTSCGPRFTIARGVPYDRALTTMAPFALCPACRREYEDPRDRRFHAEPNACPACGPHLALLAPDGRPLAEREEALAAAVQALREGRIVAVKGVGGFHLACDARAPAAVARLRLRKRREEKPLAVMPRDLAEAELLCELGDAERRLLTSPERPIVLAPRRDGCDVAPEVAPDTPLLGLLLPYAPLHHLLLEGVRRPLVMTSANLSEEPIAYRDGEAVARLSGVADLLLVHDREIETRADDSVARVVAGAPVLLRRSRGYAPRPVRLARALGRPVLAVGALLKNTFCLGVGDAAHLGPHIGDLENLETLASFEGAVARLEQFLRARPALLAHDLHPDFTSTRYALERARAEGLPAVAVQHHHAHAAGCMAEHGLEGPALALTWDGTGLGDDGAAWGGELLLARYGGYERLATFRPVALAGGDKAIREPWRVALAALDDAFGGAPPLEALPLFRAAPAGEVALVRQMIARGFNAPPAHGAGRLFDAAAALALARPRAGYEGQLAMALEAVAGGTSPGRYAFHVDTSTAPWQLDWRPLVRELAGDVVAGRPAGLVAARFHGALVAAAAELVRLAAARHGRLPVVLSGGCFANARLAEGIIHELSGVFQVYLPRAAPPGDGGIALGQAVVADARAGA
ncbi:carbamoyltransferase HypF [Anaeromyxobacter diazotrophicus]|uniref:Carbamoyltransferase n=1 Tax=Anaeromyxobacter diazotrophicus TaxID=2590199 RepID=A0A7I9VHC3_9BACT|nr:carbamoyltransferase HypF [Anaeromyxobacter diazotrophicus]GEJ55745.1 carbamoyltransferase HypF [Anaeromyxobacter diazotrophicus]